MKKIKKIIYRIKYRNMTRIEDMIEDTKDEERQLWELLYNYEELRTKKSDRGFYNQMENSIDLTLEILKNIRERKERDKNE
ncbi:MAG: hypothetical protein ACRCUM_03865 [Mycoplasmoidaceae bacterium]